MIEIFILILVALAIHYATSNFRGLRPQRASNDGAMYLVLNDRDGAGDAANMLAEVHKRIETILHFLQLELDSGTIHETGLAGNVALLLRRYPHAKRNIYELLPGQDDAIAYNQNKSEQVFICLREQRNSAKVGDIDAVMFVALHELAHTMTQGYDPDINGQTRHSVEFSNCEAFIHKTAESLGLINLAKARGAPHCGIFLP